MKKVEKCSADYETRKLGRNVPKSRIIYNFETFINKEFSKMRNRNEHFFQLLTSNNGKHVSARKWTVIFHPSGKCPFWNFINGTPDRVSFWAKVLSQLHSTEQCSKLQHWSASNSSPRPGLTSAPSYHIGQKFLMEGNRFLFWAPQSAFV